MFNFIIALFKAIKLFFTGVNTASKMASIALEETNKELKDFNVYLTNLRKEMQQTNQDATLLAIQQSRADTLIGLQKINSKLANVTPAEISAYEALRNPSN